MDIKNYLSNNLLAARLYEKDSYKNSFSLSKCFDNTRKAFSRHRVYEDMFVHLLTYNVTSNIVVYNKCNPTMLVSDNSGLMEILNCNENSLRNFLRFTKERGIIKKQRFIVEDYYHYEYLINPLYNPASLEQISFVEMEIWKSEIFDSDSIIDESFYEEWKKLLPDEYLDQVDATLKSGKTATAHKKLIKICPVEFTSSEFDKNDFSVPKICDFSINLSKFTQKRNFRAKTIKNSHENVLK